MRDLFLIALVSRGIRSSESLLVGMHVLNTIGFHSNLNFATGRNASNAITKPQASKGLSEAQAGASASMSLRICAVLLVAYIGLRFQDCGDASLLAS